MNRREALGVLAGAAAGWTAPAQAAPSVPSAPSPLATRKIPSSGELLPVIGLGTWQTFDVGASAQARQPLEAVLSEFARLGGRVLDSSPMYGSAEQVAGDLASKLGIRKQLFVATKVWTTGRAAGVRQMEESMARLQARPIDLMQVHNLHDVSTHLATLREWKRQGIVRHIGVTHYAASAHDQLVRLIAAEAVDFIQINYSVGEREAEQRLLPLARERGIAVIANRPFAGGELIRSLLGKPLPDWARDIDCTSWAQLLLKFVVSHGAITCAIPATSKVGHLRDNMGAGLGRMPDDKQRALIARLALA